MSWESLQQNGGRGFSGPEVFPATGHGVVVFGQEAMELSSKGHDMVLGVLDTRMVMIAHGDGPQSLDIGVFGRDRRAIEEGLVGCLRGPQEELPLRTSTAEEPNATLGDVTGHGHGR